jgi:hypothetical protein
LAAGALSSAVWTASAGGAAAGCNIVGGDSNVPGTAGPKLSAWMLQPRQSLSFSPQLSRPLLIKLPTAAVRQRWRAAAAATCTTKSRQAAKWQRGDGVEMFTLFITFIILPNEMVTSFFPF